MTTYEIRKLERLLEEQFVDHDTAMGIIEAALAHNRNRAVQKIESTLRTLPVACPPSTSTL